MFISGYANTENVFYCLIRGDVQHKGHDCHGAPGVHIRELSNDDADGNESGKKAIGLINKTTTLHMHHAFLVHFFTVVARLQRESA